MPSFLLTGQELVNIFVGVYYLVLIGLVLISMKSD